MAGNNGMDDGRFVGCDHCTENLAGICGHCGGDHHGPDCPTLRGVKPFSPEELEEIQERLAVTQGVGIEGTGTPDSRELVALIVRDYRSIQAALQTPDDPAALGILQILWGSGVNE